MKPFVYSLLIVFSVIFFSCKKKDDNLIKNLSELKSRLDISDTFYVDKNNGFDLKFKQNYIFRASQSNLQSAYGDLLVLNDSTMLIASVRGAQIADFVKKSIYIATSRNKGETWFNLKKIEHQNNDYLNVSGPSLIKISNKHLMLFVGMKYSETRIDIIVKESFDAGNSWSDDKVVYKSDIGYQTVNNNRVLYVDGRIIIPIAVPSNKNDLYGSIANNMTVYCLYSDDLGKTWNKSPDLLINGLALLEPGIEYLGNKTLLMNIRLNIGTVLFAKSVDFGMSWRFATSEFDSPSSPQKVYKIAENKLIMVWNNTRENYALHGLNRSPLSVAVSEDGGTRWKILGNLETGVGFDFSYPSITSDRENVYITYFEMFPQKGHALKLSVIKKSDLSLGL